MPIQASPHTSQMLKLSGPADGGRLGHGDGGLWDGLFGRCDRNFGALAGSDFRCLPPRIYQGFQKADAKEPEWWKNATQELCAEYSGCEAAVKRCSHARQRAAFDPLRCARRRGPGAWVRLSAFRANRA